MISADIKANKNNKKKNILWLHLTNFYKLEIQCKKGMDFSFV